MRKNEGKRLPMSKNVFYRLVGIERENGKKATIHPIFMVPGACVEWATFAQ